MDFIISPEPSDVLQKQQNVREFSVILFTKHLTTHDIFFSSFGNTLLLCPHPTYKEANVLSCSILGALTFSAVLSRERGAVMPCPFIDSAFAMVKMCSAVESGMVKDRISHWAV